MYLCSGKKDGYEYPAHWCNYSAPAICKVCGRWFAFSISGFEKILTNRKRERCTRSIVSRWIDGSSLSSFRAIRGWFCLPYSCRFPVAHDFGTIYVEGWLKDVRRRFKVLNDMRSETGISVHNSSLMHARPYKPSCVLYTMIVVLWYCSVLANFKKSPIVSIMHIFSETLLWETLLETIVITYCAHLLLA